MSKWPDLSQFSPPKKFGNFWKKNQLTKSDLTNSLVKMSYPVPDRVKCKTTVYVSLNSPQLTLPSTAGPCRRFRISWAACRIVQWWHKLHLISLSQITHLRKNRNTGGPPLTRKSLTQFPLTRFLAYIPVSGGLSASRGPQYSTANMCSGITIEVHLKNCNFEKLQFFTVDLCSLYFLQVKKCRFNTIFM